MYFLHYFISRLVLGLFLLHSEVDLLLLELQANLPHLEGLLKRVRLFFHLDKRVIQTLDFVHVHLDHELCVFVLLLSFLKSRKHFLQVLTHHPDLLRSLINVFLDCGFLLRDLARKQWRQVLEVQWNPQGLVVHPVPDLLTKVVDF